MVSDKNTCRLCDCKSYTGIKVFGKRGRQLHIQPIILQHFSLELTENDELSNFICQKCWRTTDHFHDLYCKVKRNMVKLNVSNPKTENHVLKDEIKSEEPVYNEVEVTSKDVPIDENSETVLKSENEIIDDRNDLEYSDYESTSTNNQSTISPPKRIGKNKSRVKFKSNKTIPQSDDVKVSNRIKLAEQNKEISDFLGIKCEMCIFSTGTFTDLKRHFISDHRMIGYLRCCKRKFFRQNKLYNHIINHRFPNQYKCHVCEKSFLDKECLHKHIKTHDPTRKKFECSKCSKRYEKKNLLDIHIHRAHGDGDIPKPCICDICKKCFSTKYAVAAHLLTIHTDKGNHICDACAKVFRSRTQLDQHYKVNHMGIVRPKVQCTICGAWLTDKYNLRKHIRRHTDTTQNCTMCEKTFANRDFLNNHIRHVHGSKPHQCPMCDKAFVSPTILREHISTHTGYSLYKCPYCTMEFKSGANMYKHRRNSHPVEWEQDRGKHIETRLNTPNILIFN